MESTDKTWKDGWKDKDVVFEDNHKGYNVIIKNPINPPRFLGYVKVPKNHKYYGLPYNEIDIIVHGGLTFSEEIDNEWWIGWDYGHPGDGDGKYELNDILVDCCYVIEQLIRNEIISGQSKTSKEILKYIEEKKHRYGKDR
jgi:hypothetical protein